MYHKIILQPSSKPNLPSIVTIGKFDGLHLGHMRLISTLNQVSLTHGYRRIVITFEPYPLEYFYDLTQKPRLPRLGLLRDKCFFLAQSGYVDELIILRFNAKLANLSPQQFIRKILRQGLNAVHMVVGQDFRFGKNGAGDVWDLIKEKLEVTVCLPYLIKQQPLSSSSIRNFASCNKLDLIFQCLGHNLQYTSRVVHGNKLGSKFGVPTINLALGKNCPALWGIYVAKVYIEGKAYPAVASIGKNPTTATTDKYKLEAHLLNVNLNLYGKIATVEILQFIRKEKKFRDLTTLFKQIQQDIDKARQYFQLTG